MLPGSSALRRVRGGWRCANRARTSSRIRHCLTTLACGRPLFRPAEACGAAASTTRIGLLTASKGRHWSQSRGNCGSEVGLTGYEVGLTGYIVGDETPSFFAGPDRPAYL